MYCSEFLCCNQFFHCCLFVWSFKVKQLVVWLPESGLLDEMESRGWVKLQKNLRHFVSFFLSLFLLFTFMFCWLASFFCFQSCYKVACLVDDGQVEFWFLVESVCMINQKFWTQVAAENCSKASDFPDLRDSFLEFFVSLFGLAVWLAVV